MKIISKIKIHPLFYLFSLICIFNGLFKDFIYIMFIISFHELGHILCGLYYKWNIKKIVVLPMGAITIFEVFINTKLKEEFIVTIMGPLFQMLLFFIGNYKFTHYNILLLLFNLIPIIPLDGSKLLNIIFNKIFPFKMGLLLSDIISIILITVLLILKNSLIELLIVFFLILKVIDSVKKRKLIFNKFLFERYLYKFKFNKQKIVNGVYDMKKDYKHLFYIDKTYITEKNYLVKKFDK